MRNLFNRRARALAIVSAAATAGLAASVQTASAQTWVNPNNGNWSLPGNWVGGVAPASGASTALFFNATGTQTYTATNDIANPFQLNSITFNNSGTGQINLNGSALSFGGASPTINVLGSGAQSIGNAVTIGSGADQTPLTISGSGNGALNFTGALSSNPAATGVLGGAVLQDSLSSVNFTGGANLYGVASNQGSINFTAGSYTFTSTERGPDPVGTTTLDGGHWGVAIGRNPGQTARLLVNNATITTNSFMVGDGGTGIGVISGGTITMPQTGNVWFGINNGTGSLTVNNGSRVTTNFFDIGRQLTSNASFVMDGANTRIDAMQTVMRGNSIGTISNGAVLNVGTGSGNGSTFFPTGANSVGTLNITSGGQLTQGGQVTVGAGTNSIGVVTISDGGDWITNGGNSFIGSSSAGPGARGSVIVTGANSSFQTLRPAAAGGQVSIGNTAFGTLSVENGATSQSNTMFMGNSTVGRGTLNVSGPGSTVTNNDVIVASGGGTNAGQSTVSVSNGGTIRSLRLTFGQNALGITNVLATGASTITTQGIGAATGSWAMGLGSTDAVATINIQNGAFAGAGGAFFLSGGVGSNSGGHTTFNVNNASAAGNFIQIGQNANGQGTFNISNAGTVTINTNTIVGLDETAAGTFTVSGAGSTLNTPAMSAAFVNSGPTGDMIPGGSGHIAVTNSGRINTTGSGITIASNAESTGRLIVSGPNSKIVGTGTAQLVIGSNGAGSMTIDNGAEMTMAGNSFFGSGSTSSSQTLVSGGTYAGGNQMQIGGSGGNAGGASVFTITNNGAASSGGLTNVYTSGTLNVGVGTSAGRYTSGGDMVVNGNVFYNAGVLSATGTLGVGGNVILSSAARNASGTPSNKKLLEVGQATLTSSGVIDLNDNDMLIHDTTAGALQKYETFVKNARNGGAWDQPGITSTAAKNSAPANKNLGVVSGADFISVGNTTFNGKTVVGTDTLIKFTFNGDTDLNGVVNFDDYARTDSGFNNGRSGWFNGDFDYNGQVNFDDYGAIDLAFNTQGGQVLALGNGPAGPGMDRAIVAAGAGHIATLEELDGKLALPNGELAFAESAVADLSMSGTVGNGGSLQAVPEPGALSVLGLAVLGTLRRRRRNHG